MEINFSGRFQRDLGASFLCLSAVAARVNVVRERGDCKRGTSGPSVNRRYSF